MQVQEIKKPKRQFNKVPCMTCGESKVDRFSRHGDCADCRPTITCIACKEPFKRMLTRSNCQTSQVCSKCAKTHLKKAREGLFNA